MYPLTFLFALATLAVTFYLEFTGISLIARQGYAENYITKQRKGKIWRRMFGDEEKVLKMVKYVNSILMMIIGVVTLLLTIGLIIYGFYR